MRDARARLEKLLTDAEECELIIAGKRHDEPDGLSGLAKGREQHDREDQHQPTTRVHRPATRYAMARLRYSTSRQRWLRDDGFQT